MPESDEVEGAAAIERAREALALALIDANLPRFTFSAGVCDASVISFDQATLRADEGLLHAKNAGRDRVVSYRDIHAPDETKAESVDSRDQM